MAFVLYRTGARPEGMCRLSFRKKRAFARCAGDVSQTSRAPSAWPPAFPLAMPFPVPNRRNSSANCGALPGRRILGTARKTADAPSAIGTRLALQFFEGRELSIPIRGPRS
jgi:hypothetical protein